MGPLARFLTHDGQPRTLVHGDLIGRLSSAALHIDDARVSEAHAMVSLRGGELKLLALRGRFAVNGKQVSAVRLHAGLQVALARGLVLTVEEVLLPATVLALEGEGLPRQVLSGVSSVYTRPRPRVASRFEGDAQAWLWSTGESWRVRHADGSVQALEPGPLPIAGHAFQVVEVALERAAQDRTRVAGGVNAPMTLVANYDTVHIRREGEPVLPLTGKQARLVSELVACGAPVSWESVARQVWPGGHDSNALRRKWDVTLARLRSKLGAAGVRRDLVRADGTGNFELLLHDGDTVVDNT